MLNKIFRLFRPQINPELIREKYNIPQNIKLNIELTKDGWFVAASPDLPGLIAQARNAKELLEMVNDAILTYFDVPKKESDFVFDTINIAGHGTISYKHKNKFQTV